jgi:hypothetical protein
MRTPRLRRTGIAAVTLGLAATLAACSTPAPEGSASSGAEAGSGEAAGPRVAVAYEGGILVLDGKTPRATTATSWSP